MLQELAVLVSSFIGLRPTDGAPHSFEVALQKLQLKSVAWEIHSSPVPMNLKKELTAVCVRIGAHLGMQQINNL